MEILPKICNCMNSTKTNCKCLPKSTYINLRIVLICLTINYLCCNFDTHLFCDIYHCALPAYLVSSLIVKTAAPRLIALVIRILNKHWFVIYKFLSTINLRLLKFIGLNVRKNEVFNFQLMEYVLATWTTYYVVTVPNNSYCFWADLPLESPV